jgi:PAS domain S-box-containing protein
MQEQFYKKVIESAPFGYAYHKIILDKNGTPVDYEFINVNNAFEKLTGLKGKDIIKKPVTDVLPDIYKGEFDWVSFYGEIALKGGEKIFEQYSKQLKKYYRVTVHSPKKYYFVTIFTDISERKKAEELLRESEKKYRLLTENTVDLIFYTDLKLKFIYMSPHIYNSMGYYPEEIIGTRVFKYTSRKEFIKIARVAIKTIINYESNPEALFETKLIHKNGQEVPVEISGRVVLSEKGKPIGIQGNIRDITKRKKVEEKLKDSEEQLRNFIKNVPVGLYRTTIDGKILLANPALVSMLNFNSIEELNNVNIEKGNLIQKNYRNLFKKRIDENDNIIGYESKWKKKDGEEIFVRENARVFRDKNGAISYYEGAVEDITDRIKVEEKLKENEKRLKELNATKDKFFSIIAHDLSNPIGSIVNFTELLSRNFIEYSDDSKEEIIKALNESSKHTFELLQNLLEWSRSQTGQIKFSPVIFNSSEVVDENVNLMKSSADTKKVSLKSKVKSNHKAFADKNMINTVIRNLISNAIKFTESGNVTISSETEDDYIKISVIDTGVGIKKEDIDKLFKIEESISSEGTSGEKGTGLGLILCKEFVEKHDGKIWVESKVGKGSKFIFTIPQAN